MPHNHFDPTAAILTHLNAPYGKVVSRAQLLATLRSGSLDAAAPDEVAQAVLSTLFMECSGAMVGEACAQANIPLQSAHNLYKSLKASGVQPTIPSWESAVQDTLC
ncbi:hypothetical protein ACWKWV_05210 [Castellaniella ginsengisoli]